VLRAHVVQHRVHDQPHPALVQPVDQLPEHTLVAEHRVYQLVVDSVVFVVGVRSENRRQVHRLGAEILEVIEMIDHAA